MSMSVSMFMPLPRPARSTAQVSHVPTPSGTPAPSTPWVTPHLPPRSTLEARLEALAATEVADGSALDHDGTREGFVAAYRDGQRRVLREALTEVAAMAEGAEEDDDVIANEDAE